MHTHVHTHACANTHVREHAQTRTRTWMRTRTRTRIRTRTRTRIRTRACTHARTLACTRTRTRTRTRTHTRALPRVHHATYTLSLCLWHPLSLTHTPAPLPVSAYISPSFSVPIVALCLRDYLCLCVVLFVCICIHMSLSRYLCHTLWLPLFVSCSSLARTRTLSLSSLLSHTHTSQSCHHKCTTLASCTAAMVPVVWFLLKPPP